MLKKTKINMIIISALTIVLGIIMLVNPVGATVTICRIIGIVLICAGALTTVVYFLAAGLGFGSGALVSGIIELAFGIWITARPSSFVTLFGIILGCFIVLHGVNTFQNALETKRVGYERWWIMLCLAILTVVLGVLTVFLPMGTTAAAMIIVGIFLIIDGVCNLFVSIKVSKAVNDYRESNGFIETTGREK